MPLLPSFRYYRFYHFTILPLLPVLTFYRFWPFYRFPHITAPYRTGFAIWALSFSANSGITAAQLVPDLPFITPKLFPVFPFLPFCRSYRLYRFTGVTLYHSTALTGFTVPPLSGCTIYHTIALTGVTIVPFPHVTKPGSETQPAPLG